MLTDVYVVVDGGSEIFNCTDVDTKQILLPSYALTWKMLDTVFFKHQKKHPKLVQPAINVNRVSILSRNPFKKHTKNHQEKIPILKTQEKTPRQKNTNLEKSLKKKPMLRFGQNSAKLLKNGEKTHKTQFRLPLI